LRFAALYSCVWLISPHPAQARLSASKVSIFSRTSVPPLIAIIRRGALRTARIRVCRNQLQLRELLEIAQLRDPGTGLFAACDYVDSGTAIKGCVMRSRLTSVLAILILTVAPIAGASAQVSQGNSSQTNAVLNFAPPPPMPNFLQGRIPAPLTVPPQSPTIDGPLSDPLAAVPAAPGTPPSVFGSTPAPSVFTRQPPSVFGATSVPSVFAPQ
jgi:hypothetical protein